MSYCTKCRTRLDEHTRAVIEYGKRIRICLKQKELQPIPVPEQIVVLLALTDGLFDSIPLAKMQESEEALRQKFANEHQDILKRMFSDSPLSNSDRDAIVTIARNVLALFQDKND